jgi:hypothetical protein
MVDSRRYSRTRNFLILVLENSITRRAVSLSEANSFGRKFIQRTRIGYRTNAFGHENHLSGKSDN